MRFCVAAIAVNAIVTESSALAWALFALIAVVVVTAVFSPSDRMMEAAKEVLRILLGRRHG